MDRHHLWISMDSMKRHFFLKNELKRKLLKSIKSSKSVSYSRRYKASYHLTTLVRISSNSFYVNRCVISGRSWSVTRTANYSRFVFREEAYNSNIPGCRRASW